MAIKQVTTLTRPNNTIPWHDPNFSDPNRPVNAVGVFLADGRILSEHIEETDDPRVNTIVFKDADAICDWWFNRMVDADAKAAYHEQRSRNEAILAKMKEEAARIHK